MRGRLSALSPAVAVLVGALFPILLVVRAHRVNGADGFPLDDAWIHLTFARNLAEHGTFAYFPGEPAVQGSTSPLYTLLLATAWRAVHDEKVLSYALGIAAHAGFLALLAVWARRRGLPGAWGAAVVAVVALDPRFPILAASGMETSLFLLLVAATFAFHAGGRRTAEGIAIGLATWARPEGLLLGAASALDLLVDRGRRAVTGGAAAAAVLVALYVAFNLGVGGTLLPHTFAAKTAFYAQNSRSSFLAHDVLHALSSRGLAILLALAIGGVVAALPRAVRRGTDAARAETLWVAGLVGAYVAVLPFTHRFDRYLVPVVPALAVLGVRAARALPWRPLGVAAIAGAVALQAMGARIAVGEYSRLCRYHLDRHERVGRWLAAHVPPSAVVAAHDVGALAFYSERRIVDVVGVVLPEAVGHLNDAGYLDYLRELFARRGVTHVAALRNWLEVANVEPLFVATPEPEILEVYPWIPGRSHLVPRAATRLNDEAARLIVDGDVASALGRLEESLRVDRDSARTWVLRGGACEVAGKLGDAESSYREALAREPESPDARLRLAAVVGARGRRDEARELVAPLRDHPTAGSRARELERALGGLGGVSGVAP